MLRWAIELGNRGLYAAVSADWACGVTEDTLLWEDRAEADKFLRLYVWESDARLTQVEQPK